MRSGHNLPAPPLLHAFAHTGSLTLRPAHTWTTACRAPVLVPRTVCIDHSRAEALQCCDQGPHACKAPTVHLKSSTRRGESSLKTGSADLASCSIEVPQLKSLTEVTHIHRHNITSCKAPHCPTAAPNPSPSSTTLPPHTPRTPNRSPQPHPTINPVHTAPQHPPHHTVPPRSHLDREVPLHRPQLRAVLPLIRRPRRRRRRWRAA